MTMNKRDLRRFVTDFRSGIIGSGSSAWMCFAVCAPLATLLPNICGVDVALTEGEVPHALCNHVWLTLPDGTIIDPTADQFVTPTGGKMPKVYIGEKPAWYQSNT